MPNKEELTCPVCKKLGEPEEVRLSNDLLKTVTVYMKLNCVECGMYWTADKGWRPK